MPRFFIRQDQIENDKVYICGDDARHISRALRMAAGENITVCDMQGIEYECELCEFDPSGERVGARILSSRPSENEPRCIIKLFQALPKGDKLDSVIQKAVECGVCEIIPFESERCVVRMKNDAEDKKTVRRERIAAEAAKQCGRSVIPSVSRTVDFNSAIEMASKCDLPLFCYEGDGTVPLMRLLDEFSLSDFEKREGRMPTVAVVIGSEGGFSLSEVERAKNAGASLCGLGRRILRTETAPIFVLSALVCVTELN